MFRSRSRGFYLYMFLRSWTERERGRERELDNLAIRYIYSFIEYCFSVRYCAARKGIQQYFSLSLFRYDSNLLDWILDGCIRTREPYTILPSLSFSLSLSKSKVWRMKSESRVWFVSFRGGWTVKFAWLPTRGNDPHHMSAVRLVFFILARFYGP